MRGEAQQARSEQVGWIAAAYERTTKEREGRVTGRPDLWRREGGNPGSRTTGDAADAVQHRAGVWVGAQGKHLTTRTLLAGIQVLGCGASRGQGRGEGARSRWKKGRCQQARGPRMPPR